MFTQLLLLLLLTIANAQLDASNPVCQACHKVLSTIQHTIPPRPLEQVLDLIGTTYCSKKHLQNHDVCKGAVTQMVGPITNSLWRHYTDPHSFCHKIRVCPKEYKIRNLQDDINKILSGNPNKQWETPTKRKILKVMHISDLHPDLYYTVGAPAKCSEPVCCRSNVTSKLSLNDVWRKLQRGQHLQVSGVEGGAGFWGSLNSCDMPFQTFNLFLQEIQKLKPDVIYWTGDNTPHDVWQQTQSYNLNFTTILSERIRKHTNARVMAAMGNHQSFPVNVYDYQGQRESMLNGGLAQAWKPWLDNQAYQMLRTKGYFSMTVPEMNNLKIISVNTQAQNDMNWFLLRDPTDPGQMLKWIQQQLKQSEAKGQFVHIIGHIAPVSALNDWSMRFNALTERYAYTIRGQFYGHSHRDHIGLVPTSKNKTKLAAFYFIAPSLTTYSDKHPQYRMMTVDADTLQVLDYQQYRLDLTKYTKKEQDAHFEIFYTFKEAYGLQDMTIRGGMSKFRQMLQNDQNTQKKYSYLRSSGVQEGRSGRNIYCDTATSPQYQAECRGKKFTPSKFEKVAGNWKDLQHK